MSAGRMAVVSAGGKIVSPGTTSVVSGGVLTPSASGSVPDGAVVPSESNGRASSSREGGGSVSVSVSSGAVPGVIGRGKSGGSATDAAGSLIGLVVMLASLTEEQRAKVDRAISRYMKCKNCLIRKKQVAYGFHTRNYSLMH